MFGPNTTSAGAISKYTVYFGTLFSDVWLKRFDNSGTIVQTQKVPLNYGPRDKFLARAEGDDDLQRQIAIQLPRMSFELKTFFYDTTRKINPLNRILASDGNGGYDFQYQPIPYKFIYELNIMVKNVEDGLYILEQILPHFQPTWQAKVNLGDTADTQYDVPITLNDNTHTDTYEGSFMDRRAIIWTLTFTMDAYLFQPPRNANTGIIKSIDLNFYNTSDVSSANSTNSLPSFVANVVPGQFANGEPTSTSIPLWEYSIANTVGVFTPTEIVRYGSNTASVAFANSSYMSSRNIEGNFVANTQIVGESGAAANIINITRVPTASVDYNSIEANSSYGYIVRFTDVGWSLSDSLPDRGGLPFLPAGYQFVVDDNGFYLVDENGNFILTEL